MRGEPGAGVLRVAGDLRAQLVFAGKARFRTQERAKVDADALA